MDELFAAEIGRGGGGGNPNILFFKNTSHNSFKNTTLLTCFRYVSPLLQIGISVLQRGRLDLQDWIAHVLYVQEFLSIFFYSNSPYVNGQYFMVMSKLHYVCSNVLN